jgi:hypothetical protein
MRVLKSIDLKDYIIFYLYIKARVIAEFFLFTLPNLRRINKFKGFKNTKKGKKAFVFANGPSLEKIDPYKIKKYQKMGYDVLSGNSYINTSFGEIVVPDFYIFSDNVHFSTAIDQYSIDVKKILELKIPVFIPHRFCRKIDWPNSYVFNDSFDFFCNNVVDMTKRGGYISMTHLKAISAACYMGYEKIYICGFDFDYFKSYQVDEDNNIYFLANHFYSKENSESVKIKEEIHKSMGELLLNMSLSFVGIDKFKSKPIINLSKCGLVDSFSKKHTLDVYR